MLKILNIACLHGIVLSVALTASIFVGSGCEKVPLFAPNGSTMTLTASATALSLNGTAQLTAAVIEASGNPPHSGTHIVFTTTLGSIQPPEADTDINGRATVTFQAGSTSGTASITASSGGASVTAANAVKIAVGAAAVGRVSLVANPGIIPAVGGTSVITANVLDVNGSPLSSVPVNFTTSSGSLSAATVNADATGAAQTVLSTSITATVTATVGVTGATGGGTGGGGTGGGGTGTGGGGTGTGGGGTTGGQASATVTVTVSPLPTISIAPQTTSGATFTAGSPITFTISVQPGTNSTAQIRDVTVDFGDGSRPRDLGSLTGTNIPIQYTYSAAGTYVVRATAVDTLNSSVSGATQVVVLPQPPLSVSLNSSQVTSGTTTTVTFTATVTPNTATVASYLWNFGDGSSPQTTSGNQVVHQYPAGSGVKIVSVNVTTTTGQTTSTQIAINP